MAVGIVRKDITLAVMGLALLLFPFALYFWKRRHLDRYHARHT